MDVICFHINAKQTLVWQNILLVILNILYNPIIKMVCEISLHKFHFILEFVNIIANIIAIGRKFSYPSTLHVCMVNYTRKISHFVVSLPTSRQQVVFPQVVNKSGTTCQ